MAPAPRHSLIALLLLVALLVAFVGEKLRKLLSAENDSFLPWHMVKEGDTEHILQTHRLVATRWNNRDWPQTAHPFGARALILHKLSA